tara:strand:+ start:9069 stop:9326 length:258 start_codon:yes stop_codon:yes gene_type:complete
MNDTNYISIDGTDTITITDYTMDSFTLDDTTLTITTDVIPEPTVLTKEKINKLEALLKVIEDLEDDNPLKECYNAQIMLDKIKGK